MTQCGDIRDALLRGRLPEDAGVRTHLETCAACAALAESADPLRSALNTAQKETFDVDALYAGVKTRIASEDRGLGGWLRSRPTWARMAIGAAAILVIIFPVFVIRPRGDLDAYPLDRMILTLFSTGIALAVTLTVALRPAYRPPLARAVFGGITLVVLLVLFLFSAMPIPGAEPADASVTGAIPCFSAGLLFATPVYFLVRALDHRVTRLAAVLAASTAGVTAYLALHLHCANTQPAHIMLGHFGVAAVFLAIVAAMSARAR